MSDINSFVAIFRYSHPIDAGVARLVGVEPEEELQELLTCIISAEDLTVARRLVEDMLPVVLVNRIGDAADEERANTQVTPLSIFLNDLRVAGQGVLDEIAQHLPAEERDDSQDDD